MESLFLKRYRFSHTERFHSGRAKDDPNQPYERAPNREARHQYVHVRLSCRRTRTVSLQQTFVSANPVIA